MSSTWPSAPGLDALVVEARKRSASVLAAHVRTCQLSHCTACKLAGNFAAWTEVHPWLAVVQRRSLLTVACVVCKQGTWGTGTRGIEDLRLSQCQRHSESWGHMKALQAHTPSQSGANTPADAAGAPGADLFHKLLDKPESATVEHGGVHCERKKCAQLRFCLAEAKRQRVRAFLRKSVFITLEQDVAQKRLVVLFTAATQSLHGLQGPVGVSFHLVGGLRGATNLLKATRELLGTLCTPFNAAPRVPFRKQQWVKRQQVVDSDLEAHIYRNVRALCTDAAPDEMQAGRLLQGTHGGSAPGAEEDSGAPDAADTQTFRNLLVHQRDLTHATRRLP